MNPDDWKPARTPEERCARMEQKIRDLERKHAQQIELIAAELAALNRRFDAAQPIALDAEEDGMPRTYWSIPRF